MFPSDPDGPPPSLGPHIDGQPWQLGSITLLDDCPPRSGGTTIWPGSHKVLYYDHKHEYNFTPKGALRSWANLVDSLVF